MRGCDVGGGGCNLKRIDIFSIASSQLQTASSNLQGGKCLSMRVGAKNGAHVAGQNSKIPCLAVPKSSMHQVPPTLERSPAAQPNSKVKIRDMIRSGNNCQIVITGRNDLSRRTCRWPEVAHRQGRSPAQQVGRSRTCIGPTAADSGFRKSNL